MDWLFWLTDFSRALGGERSSSIFSNTSNIRAVQKDGSAVVLKYCCSFSGWRSRRRGICSISRRSLSSFLGDGAAGACAGEINWKRVCLLLDRDCLQYYDINLHTLHAKKSNQAPVQPMSILKSAKTLNMEPALATAAYIYTQIRNAASFEPMESVTKETVLSSTSNRPVNIG